MQYFSEEEEEEAVDADAEKLFPLSLAMFRLSVLSVWRLAAANNSLRCGIRAAARSVRIAGRCDDVCCSPHPDTPPPNCADYRFS